MTSQPGKQVTTMHISANISRKQGNQKVKFGQLIEYNMRKIFRGKYTQIVVETLFADPFLKNQN